MLAPVLTRHLDLLRERREEPSLVPSFFRFLPSRELHLLCLPRQGSCTSLPRMSRLSLCDRSWLDSCNSATSKPHRRHQSPPPGEAARQPPGTQRRLPAATTSKHSHSHYSHKEFAPSSGTAFSSCYFLLSRTSRATNTLNCNRQTYVDVPVICLYSVWEYCSVFCVLRDIHTS